MRREAAVFASVSSLFGLITPQTHHGRAAPRSPRRTVARGALLCETFEAYRALVGEPQISFEHAVLPARSAASPATSCGSRIAATARACWLPTGSRCARRSATTAASVRTASRDRRRAGRSGRRRAGAGGRFARVTIRPTLFSGPFLDRRAELRDDPDWVAAARADPNTRYVLAAGPRQLVSVGAAMDVALLRNGDPLVSAAPTTAR